MRIYIDFLSRSQVQRIVITSSCAAVLTLALSKPTVFSEQDWNLSSIKDVQEKGNKIALSSAYRASKTLAEKGEFLERLVFRSPYMFLANQLHGNFTSSTSLRLNGIWLLLTLHM